MAWGCLTKREDYVEEASAKMQLRIRRYADEGEAVNIVSNKNVSRKGAKAQRKDSR